MYMYFEKDIIMLYNYFTYVIFLFMILLLFIVCMFDC